MPQDLPPHVQWLLDHRGPALRTALDKSGVLLGLEDALDVLVRADPSPGGHAVQWLCDALIGGGLLWEDVAGAATSKAGETLRWFAQHRRALPRGQRNLEDYPGLAEVYLAIEPMLEPVVEVEVESGRAARRSARRQALESSLVLCQRPDLLVAVPLTQGASQWWGHGTRWCTAAREHNMFHDYNSQGPLVVIILPDVPGCKLQLHVHESPYGQVHFMDAGDRMVDKEFMAQHWSRLEPVIRWALEHGLASMVQYVPSEHLDYEMACRLVDANASALSYLPQELVDINLCWRSIMSRRGKLDEIPVQFRTSAICRQAFEDNPDCFPCIPAHSQTSMMCRQAVAYNARFLQWVAPHLKTPEICTIALGRDGSALAFVPPRIRTHSMVALSLQSWGRSLEYVPWLYRTPRVCGRAVDLDGSALAMVPNIYRTRSMCMRALASLQRMALRGEDFDSILGEIPARFVDRALYMQVLAITGRSLREVPKGMRDAEMCRLAVGNYPMAIRHVPPDVLDEAMCLDVVRGDPMELSSIPRDKQTRAVCLLVLATHPRCIRWVPTDLKTQDFYARMAGGNDDALCEIPPDARDAQVCTIALQRNPDQLEHVPEHILPQIADLVASLGIEARTAHWRADVALAGLGAALAAGQHTQDMTHPQKSQNSSSPG